MADTLIADIQNYSADAAKLTMEIAELDDDISIWEGEIKAATNVSEIEKNDYDTLHKDYSESIHALQRATDVLKKQFGDRKYGAFVQVAAFQEISLIPQEVKAAINLFLQDAEPTEGLAGITPDANPYEFQSSRVVEMLEKLLDKFEDERTTLEQLEMISKHAYNMLLQDFNAQMAQGTQDLFQKASSLATLRADPNTQANTRDAQYVASHAKQLNSHGFQMLVRPEQTSGWQLCKLGRGDDKVGIPFLPFTKQTASPSISSPTSGPTEE